jgi:hypothetical protein
MNRKQRRAQAKASDAERYLSRKVTLFGLLPGDCNTCQKPFDKKNKEMAMSWSVIVHQETEKVRLFCPACVEKDKKAIEEKENVD